jgi:hypothetical protein
VKKNPQIENLVAQLKAISSKQLPNTSTSLHLYSVYTVGGLINVRSEVRKIPENHKAVIITGFLAVLA